jgi:glycosyltransferase involved in cell wall biosynthesis
MRKNSLVSVVTPFYNTAEFLGECIESVLAQTYREFEYLLVDNQSTDGSAEIAARFAKKDSRVRVIRNEKFVGQVANYNGAVIHVAPTADYVKIVQADDWIFPECLERMVAVGDANPTAAIITSYRLKGADLCSVGIEWPTDRIAGRAAARLHLLEGRFLFGSPTTVMYRADLVRTRKPFYSESSMHEDTELCYEALMQADLGFVHQVLSFSRVGNAGILSGIETYSWVELGNYLALRKYGPAFLTDAELTDRLAVVQGDYLRILGESFVLGREDEFWDYHRRGLATIGEELPSRWALAPQIARAGVKAVARPRWALRERARFKPARSFERKATAGASA